ncbi:MAG: SDR family NAD(P)-dependent oxidoreductase [Gammaproteobacteria bacterium]|nr:SDR family NAD(P)-dependent oxidoreductase [Gammaproteobacteria bacterium]
MSNLRNPRLITGNSSGLGHALTQHCLAQGWAVYGCSRRGCADQSGNQHDLRCDLTDLEAIPGNLSTLLAGVEGLDLVFLNAGVLGQLKAMHNTSLQEIQAIMDLNVWANKQILDWLHQWGRPVRQIVCISSGAAVNGNKGWGGYALSKSALNMLVKLYAHEFPETHLCALAPGLVDTAMMDYLCTSVDADEFPAVRRIQESRGTADTPSPALAARLILDALPTLLNYPSGSYVDIRTL